MCAWCASCAAHARGVGDARGGGGPGGGSGGGNGGSHRPRHWLDSLVPGGRPAGAQTSGGLGGHQRRSRPPTGGHISRPLPARLAREWSCFPRARDEKGGNLSVNAWSHLVLLGPPRPPAAARVQADPCAMMASSCASKVLLALCLAAWVIALGGLGAINWIVCTDTQNTRDDIAYNYAANYNATWGPAAGGSPDPAAALHIPPPGTDVAFCSRSFRWEWFCLFFQFVIMAYAAARSCTPGRLMRARHAVANGLTIASVIIMVAVNEDLTTVWWFWDTHKMFAEWTGILRELYFSVAALVAGWILVIFFNLVWIGCILDARLTSGCCKKQCQHEHDVEASVTAGAAASHPKH